MLARRSRSALRGPRSSRAPGGPRRGRRSRRRSPTASPGRSGRRRARCCGPCGWCGRSGGSAAGRRRRSRARPARGSCRSTPSSPPHERGNSSYQAPKRARTRSTSIASGRSSVTLPWRSWVRSTASNSSGPSATSCLAGSGERGVLERRQRVLDQRPVAGRSGRARAAALEQQRCPPTARPARSCWPAVELAHSSSRQVPNTSVHASTVYSQRPVRSTSKLAGPADAPEVGVDPPHLAPRATARRPGRGSGRPRAAGRGRRGTRRPRPRRGRRRSAWPGSGRRRPPATGTGSRSAPAIARRGSRVVLVAPAGWTPVAGLAIA